MAFKYTISIKGNKVFVRLCECGKMNKKAYAYIKGEGSAKEIAQAVSYAASRLYKGTNWDDITPDGCDSIDIDQEELMKAIEAHEKEMEE